MECFVLVGVENIKTTSFLIGVAQRRFCTKIMHEVFVLVFTVTLCIQSPNTSTTNHLFKHEKIIFNEQGQDHQIVYWTHTLALPSRNPFPESRGS
jgi:hypothetical protein